jgi:hypothetical protein
VSGKGAGVGGGGGGDGGGCTFWSGHVGQGSDSGQIPSSVQKELPWKDRVIRDEELNDGPDYDLNTWGSQTTGYSAKLHRKIW